MKALIFFSIQIVAIIVAVAILRRKGVFLFETCPADENYDIYDTPKRKKK